MKFFLDTADVSQIFELSKLGLVDGVTTNPSLIQASGRDFLETIAEICALTEGPVSAEVIATDCDAMLAEAARLSTIAANVVIKLPLTFEGLRACRALADQGVMVNVTLCFSAVQALLAAKAGATFISPFVGRCEDIAGDGMGLIADIKEIYSNYQFRTEILVASVRSPWHVLQAAKLGADVSTVPPTVLRQLANHPLTDRGLETFMRDWSQTGQSIL